MTDVNKFFLTCIDDYLYRGLLFASKDGFFLGTKRNDINNDTNLIASLDVYGFCDALRNMIQVG